MKDSTIIYISRLITSILFIFSGFVKSVDPMGTAIKFEEYFVVFGLDFLIPLSIFLAIVLIYCEMLLGIILLLGIFRRASAWLSILFLSFFTLLTFYIYAANPVEDCGCFGDFMPLTNFETFIKNIVFLIIIIPYFRYAQKLNWVEKKPYTWIKITVSSIVILFAPIYAICRLPLIDFLPYKVGVNVFEAMEIPEGEKTDKYETTLIYKEISTGKEVEFSVEDTTWYDQSKWEYIDTKTELIEKGYTPPITSFNIFDSTYNDTTRELLENGEVALVVINDQILPSKTKLNIAFLSSENKEKNINTIIVTPFDISTISKEIPGIDINAIYNGDKTMLKTIMRAKAGVIFFSNGTITKKSNLYN